MTALGEHIKQLIRADGPLSIAEFMRIVLTSRDDSYYQNRDPFGAKGDFVTAPEISQIFGELIGLWCVDVWQQLGAPSPVTLVELGPGRGTLMRDALRAARVVPSFAKVVSVALVEVSQTLRRLQQEALQGSDVPVRWFDRFGDVDAVGPLIVVANEFFDALPIRQWVRIAQGWSERVVGVDGAGALSFGAAPGTINEALVPAPLRPGVMGSIVETSPLRSAVARSVGERLAASGGAALVVDYGFRGPAAGDTLQAVRRHAFAPVLEALGEADLTSHVDFAALGEAFARGGAHVSSIVEQGAFLERLGGAARVAALKRSATPEQSSRIDEGYARLTGANAMGSLFKVLTAYSPGTLQPAGFADA